MILNQRWQIGCLVVVVSALAIACGSESTASVSALSESGPAHEITWTEESAEPIVVQVHREVRAGNAPAEFTTERNVRYVRRDLAIELPEFEEEGADRSLEQIAQDERNVLEMSGVEYISDPDLDVARRIMNGAKSPAIESTSSDDRIGTEDAEELRERFDFGGFYSLDAVAHNYPDRTQVLLLANFGSCSGTSVGKFTEVTAAHCIHTGSGFKKNYTQYWGNSSQGSFWSQAPCGDFCACWFRSVKSGWDGDNNNISYDYAAYDLRGCPSNPAGWLGVSTTMGWDKTHYLNGYPGSPPSGSFGRLWGANGEVFSHSTLYPDRVFYRISMLSGESGSGVYRKTSTDRFVTGINTSEHSSPLWNAVNEGRRVDSTVFNFLKDNGLCQTPGFETCN